MNARTPVEEAAARPAFGGVPAEVSRSLIVPIYRNQENIPALIEALEDLNRRAATAIEVVFVIDGSPDQSGELLTAARASFSFPYQILFHSRNFGAFVAIRTGLEHARGRHVAVMAADLQEPPELILEFFSILESGTADVVFGERVSRHDDWVRDILSGGFWWVYRKLVIKDIPKGGADIFACNQAVLSAVLQIEEPNSSLIAQLFWVGFRRSFVPYNRRAREHGKSAWSL
ncbi:glycosyltransferase family 2 protein, partial [Rhodoplanes sp. SY1]|uniref:glycosyltransferase family 2 protein n=1 Tax=Rhodoplanes sp. SY1 TaxID=3166646 RepID=UPI0038B5CDF3